MEARIGLAFGLRGGGGGEHLAGDLQFGQPRAAAQFFDRRAIEISRGEIHGREAGGIFQHLIHEAHALEELGPVHVGHETHAGDDVAYRDVGRALSLVFFAHQAFGTGALRFDPLLEPLQGRHHLGVLIAKAQHELHRERGDERLAGATPVDQCARIGLLAIYSQ
jgi:hypothetical protein